MLIGLLGFLLGSCGTPMPEPVKQVYAELPETIDFNFHVKPILSDRCYTCHGPDANSRKADLRLDTEDGAFSALESGAHAFVAGNLQRSEAIKRIFSSDDQYMMPPPESNLALSVREQAIIAKWVQQGALWKNHWSFDTPVKPQLPDLFDQNNSEQAVHPIDHFINAAMQAQGLTAGGPAGKETWLRRVYLDLTGLPPSAQEIDEFLKDQSTDAFVRKVDELLDSSHFGERMALDWLDLARYADTHGYQDDGMRNTWPWRDWVIKAFNDNLPYDEFLTWQLAGDLLPNPTKEQLLATCFNRNHPQTQEGGVVDEEYRVEYVADRTNTLGKALMGLTLECARCHDHKYDPVTQKEYYQLYAFFNNNHDSGIVPYNGEASPSMLMPAPQAQKELDSLNLLLADLHPKTEQTNYTEALQLWLEQNHQQEVDLRRGLVAEFDFEQATRIDDQNLPLQVVKPGQKRRPYKENFAYQNLATGRLGAKVWGDVDSRPLVVEGIRGKGLEFRGDAGIRFRKDLDFDRHQPFSVSIWMKLNKTGESGPIFNKSNGDFEGYRGWLCKLNEDGTLSFQLNHVWPNNSIDIQTNNPLKAKQWYHIVMAYDGSSKAAGLNIYINGEVPPHRVITDNLYKSLLHGVKGSNWSYLPLLIGRENLRSSKDLALDEFKVYNRSLTAAEAQLLYKNETSPVKDLTPDQQMDYYLQAGFNGGYNRLSLRMSVLRDRINKLITDQPEVMIMKESPLKRATFVLDRGAYDAPTDQVDAQTPVTLPAMPDSLPKNRLGLALWLTDAKHPLTARVAVNRLWAMCFGKGIVATQEDFGNQGNLPTHPQLLDWLAVDFAENGWDVKALLKQIVLSATYRRSSKATEAQKQIDPANLYYTHFPVHRLPAELIRDQALAASGLLVPQVGGPSVYPYQPAGIWKALATRNATEYKQQHGDSLYRRSMYTVWKRSSPPPAMTNFDAPDRYYCVVRRQNTSTPLQSLVMMNDPQFMEAARMLGERMLKEGGEKLSQRIDFAFKSLIGRAMRPLELQKMEELYHLELSDFQGDPVRIEDWLSSGEHARDLELDQAELAAHTVVAATLMNFDEFTIKR